MSNNVRVRFAPSPTGHLHVGGARTALFNWLFARGHGGTFVLRIEDTDRARSTDESERAVLEDLKWLGLTWDEGPGADDSHGPYRQSERLDIYAEHADRLLAEGKAYRCYCTDEELEAKRKRALADGEIPQYDGTCRDLTDAERAEREREGRPAVVRMRAPSSDITVSDLVRGDVEFKKEMLGDFIVMRSDGRPTYNFAVVVDDALMEITHVIRAEEHFPNTMRQVLLYEALGYGLPAFAHVSLIVDKDRSKLSKRRGATSVAEFRDQGYLPGGLVNYLALLGWSPPEGEEVMPLEELTEKFDLARVSASPAAFDEDKLDWVNSHHIREEPLADVAALAMRFAETHGLIEPDFDRFEAMVALAREGLSRLSDLPDAISFFFDDHVQVEDDARDWLSTEGSKQLAVSLVRRLEANGDELDAATFKAALKEAGKEAGVKGKELFMPVRSALTGRTHGPALGDVAAVLGRTRVVERLRKASG
ncbi:MAG TPA: glutamate--tRNA ligase [bacterium]|nr:glutamate--tRNA ligase [bacterium]